MKLIRSREHVINMGQYESVRIGASVELDAGSSVLPEDMDSLYDAVEKILADSMRNDVEEAISLLPAGSTSHILSWGGTEAGCLEILQREELVQIQGTE